MESAAWPQSLAGQHPPLLWESATDSGRAEAARTFAAEQVLREGFKLRLL